MARGPIKHTCPKIDDAISYVESVSKVVKEMADDLLGRSGILEDLRESNDTLRNWGAEQEDRADEEEKRADKAESELEDANDTILQLRAEIKEMQLELDRVAQ